MSLTAWILLGVALWIVLGVAVALVVGRMVRHRDAQVPLDPPADVTGLVPEPRDGTDRPAERPVGGPHRTHPGPPT